MRVTQRTRSSAPLCVFPRPTLSTLTRLRLSHQLRALIAAQEQWKSAPEREALAARAALSGEGELAQALRRRDTSLLRKRHLLYLAHAWGLRSDLWRRKQRAASAVRQDAGLAPPQAPPQPQLLLPAPASPLREAALTRELQLRTYATGNMPRLRVQAAALTSGAEAVRAIRATQAYALVTPFALDEWRGVLAVNKPLLAACCSTRAKMAALRAAPKAYDDDAPAWLALHGDTSPVEALLEQVRTVYAIGVHLIQTRSEARWRDRQPTAVEHGYFEEPLESARVSLEFVARGNAALAQLRLGRVGDYLLAAEAVAQEVSEIMHQQDLAAQERLRWLSDFLTMRDTEQARAATATVAPPNFPMLEAEAAKAMPVNWSTLAAKFAT